MSDREVTTTMQAIQRGLKAEREKGYRQAAEDCIAALREHGSHGKGEFLRVADFLRDRFLSGSSPEEARERDCPKCSDPPEHVQCHDPECPTSAAVVSEEAVERIAKALAIWNDADLGASRRAGRYAFYDAEGEILADGFATTTEASEAFDGLRARAAIRAAEEER